MLTERAGLQGLWDLKGLWRLSRQIEHSGGRVDVMDGQAHFQRRGDQLVQVETGTLSVGDQRLEARQSYVWTAKGDRLCVQFSDLRAFHDVPLGVVAPLAEHFCAPDMYQVRYDFSPWPLWHSVWTVKGPRKDYVMTSDYGPKPG